MKVDWGKTEKPKMKRIFLSAFNAFLKYRVFAKKSKIYKSAAYSLAIVLAAYGSTLVFPQYLFAHEISHENFRVYSQQPFDEKINEVLDSAEARLEKSPLYEWQVESVFICNSFTFYNFLSPTSGKSFASTIPGIGNIRINKSDIDKDLVFRDAEEYNQRSLSGVIAHEVTHNLIRRKFGLINSFVSLPRWKDEGYSEYVAGETALSFTEGVQRWRAEPNDDSRYNYFKYQQMVKYVLDDEKSSVEDLFNRNFNEKELAAKVFTKICQN